MRYLWQTILHRWYMGRWPDQYVEGYDPVISNEIDKFLADVLERE